MELRNVIKSDLLPDLDIEYFRRNSSTSTKVKRLERLYWLCFANPPSTDRDSVRQAAKAYGKIFYDHNEIKQQILDMFDKYEPQEISKVDNLQQKSKDIFDEKVRYFKQNTFNITTEGQPKSELKQRYDLTQEDSSTQFQHNFSDLLASMLANPTSPYDDEKLWDYPISGREKRSKKPKMKKAYISLLLCDCMDQILSRLSNGVRYRSRQIEQKPVDAIYHYLVTRSEGKELKNRQVAKQIRHQYWIKNNGHLIKPSENSKEPLKSLEQQIRRIRKEEGLAIP